MQTCFKRVWIDTCFIDKQSSAELSEAINSMYTYYMRSGVCYAYPNDIRSGDNPRPYTSSFRRSRRFTRGALSLGCQ
ncbi:hypothetical protein K435DRAFT_754230 [Dendrothele bispora CBS 962.96]|uniref:Heterokaryon incompatibility domain-containing protein n=1 Tax=Dendrothele bispora (strain CBS 962.96) TaxID=1314807 RepID=A0A4S8M4L9_DENBC|nr:hypothetical protein K435DRAFT_754230 [Dendrothele bispora CBS 962.96]